MLQLSRSLAALLFFAFSTAESFCQTTLRVTYEGTNNALKDYFAKM